MMGSCREASPGKLGAFEDELFRNADMADVPVVAAIALAYVEGARTVRTAFPTRRPTSIQLRIKQSNLDNKALSMALESARMTTHTCTHVHGRIQQCRS